MRVIDASPTTAPATDKSAISQTIHALTKAGWTLDRTDNGEDVRDLDLTDKAAWLVALDEITATDAAHLFVKKGSERGYVWFVLGNDPEEVIADHTLNLTDVIDPLTDRWF